MTALVIPDLDHLPGYAAAMERGWSPSTTRDVRGEHLALIAADPAAFVARLVEPEGRGAAKLPDGSEIALLPGTTRFIWDGGLCGAINLRHRRGTPDLPPQVSGHIGYSVVPWRRREGHGARALALMLPVAAARGLPHVIVTCDTGNVGSRRIIEANGGIFLTEADDTAEPGLRKLVFRIDLEDQDAAG